MEGMKYNTAQSLSEVTSSIEAWCDFTRKVCYHGSTGSRDYMYCNTLPTDTATKLHKKRGDYGIIMAMESILPQSSLKIMGGTMKIVK